jgi:hypothetical protein
MSRHPASPGPAADARDAAGARDTVTLHADEVGELIALLGHLGDWLAHAAPAVRTELNTFIPTAAFDAATPVPAEQVLTELAGHTETLIRELHTHHRHHHTLGEQHR